MQAQLIIEEGTGWPRVCDLVEDQPITLGRSRDNTVILQDEHASRHHARVYHDNDRWLIEDSGPLNATLLDGARIEGPVALRDKQEIIIGDTKLRFVLHADGVPSQPASGKATSLPETAFPVPTPPTSEFSTTVLQGDELAALYALMAPAGGETDPRVLIRRALEAIAGQTGAAITGFLDLNREDPLPKIVIPENARVNIHLSRQLTQKVLAEGRAVWLQADAEEMRQNESLMPFQDALCLPLFAEGTSLGAVHVYKAGQFFRERDKHFGEVVAGFLASCLARIRIRRALEAENSRLWSHAPVSERMIGESPALQQLRQMIGRAAPRSTTVLIYGESGSGKELVAQDLHRQSPRQRAPLVVLNCAAIAPSLVEAELFGHVKGAFTGAAADRAGLFQQADEGTLFLDEIGELSLDIQAKLLRVIEGKAFRPVGGNSDVRADVRVIAATHRDLEQLVKDGKFREDLFFRLCVIRLDVPPLRAHAEDIPPLVDYFLAKLTAECGRPVRLTPAALVRLRHYSWPGNVRQLRAVLENAVVMHEGDAVDAEDLLLPTPKITDYPTGLSLDEVEAWAIRRALQKTEGNFIQAAKLLGIGRETLAVKRKKHKLN